MRGATTIHPRKVALSAVIHLAIALLAAGPAFGQEPPRDSSPDGVWEALDEVELAPRVSAPSAFAALRLDLEALQGLLAAAPRETPGRVRSDLEIAVPLPDGGFPELAVVRSPLLEPALEAAFPEIGTYVLEGVLDPGASGRLAVGPGGAHALLQTPGGLVRIEPFPAADGTTVHLSYYHHDRTDGADHLDHPEDEQAHSTGIAGALQAPSLRLAPLAAQAGDTLHVYRLAAATTGEYYQSRDTGNGLLDVLFSLVVEVSNVNAVFEPELAVRLVLSLASLSVMYDDPASDPFDNGAAPCDLRKANRDNSEAVLDDDDYDLGFLFATRGGTGGSGCAWYNVCETDGGSNHKAAAAGKIGLDNDPLVGSATGLIAHESGHQLGARHTFSGQDGGCTEDEFNQQSAFEPGSGTTIMSYRGNCGDDNVDVSEDDPLVDAGRYYHTRSFEEVTDTVTSGNGATCGSHLATANHAPIVDAGPDVTIPRGTPFTLVGSAVDPDGDPLRFVWEQFDVAADRRPIDTDTGEGPLFRSVPPSPGPARTFPAPADLLAGIQRPGEVLPSVDRVADPLTFRLTARDDRMGGGGVAYDTRLVTVQGDPFFVTSPNGGETLFAGCPVPVTWVVGGGDVAAEVDILFSGDGGAGFDPLMAATSNDGAATPLFPCTVTAGGRVEVQATDNVFFDVSDANFVLLESAPAVAVSGFGGEVDENCQTTVVFEATVTDDCGVDAGDVAVDVFAADTNFTLGTPAIQIAQVDGRTVSVEGSVAVSDVSESPAVLGVKVTAADACGAEESDFVAVEVIDATPPEIAVDLAPTLLWPPDHTMRDVTATVMATDNCPGIGFALASVVSDEPDDGPADGNTVNDIQGAEPGTADLAFRLRAERAGNGDGRTYTATYVATDASENASQAGSTVTVPRALQPAP